MRRERGFCIEAGQNVKSEAKSEEPAGRRVSSDLCRGSGGVHDRQLPALAVSYKGRCVKYGNVLESCRVYERYARTRAIGRMTTHSSCCRKCKDSDREQSRFGNGETHEVPQNRIDTANNVLECYEPPISSGRFVYRLHRIASCCSLAAADNFSVVNARSGVLVDDSTSLED